MYSLHLLMSEFGKEPGWSKELYPEKQIYPPDEGEIKEDSTSSSDMFSLQSISPTERKSLSRKPGNTYEMGEGKMLQKRTPEFFFLDFG